MRLDSGGFERCCAGRMGVGESQREGIGRGEVGRCLEKERWSRGSGDQLAVMRWASATYSQISEID